jgi:hypothetical protein
MHNKNEKADRDVFFATLALYDRPERELRQRALPGDTDVDAVVEAAFARALGNPSILPM